MEWISVKDRLPEIEQDVLICYLVTMPDDVIIQAQKVDYIHCIRQFKSKQVVDWAEYTEDIEITHWQPLPQSPSK
jgi:hypothetical protein